MQMKISRCFLSVAKIAKLISVTSIIGLIFSIVPIVHICTPTCFTGPGIVKLDVCHGSTAGIQKNIETDFVIEGADPVGPLHYAGVHAILSLIPSSLLIVFQEYPPPESAS